jgi:hypothetical protein
MKLDKKSHYGLFDWCRLKGKMKMAIKSKKKLEL